MIKPDVHIELWNAFNDISFNEPDHKYTDSKNTEYQSATGWIKQFEAETNWDEIKKNKAKKLGKTVEEITVTATSIFDTTKKGTKKLTVTA